MLITVQVTAVRVQCNVCGAQADTHNISPPEGWLSDGPIRHYCTIACRQQAKRPSQFGLRDTDRAMLGHLAQGLTNGQIAQRMDFSPNWIRNRLSQIYRRLNVTGRTDAALKAQRLGLIT